MKDMIKLVDLKLIPEKLWTVSTSDKLKNVVDTSFSAKTEEAKMLKKMYEL